METAAALQTSTAAVSNDSGHPGAVITPDTIVFRSPEYRDQRLDLRDLALMGPHNRENVAAAALAALTAGAELAAIQNQDALVLTPSQRELVERIMVLVEQREAARCLVYGVTGSGKTEVSINLAIDRKMAGMNVRIAGQIRLALDLTDLVVQVTLEHVMDEPVAADDLPADARSLGSLIERVWACVRTMPGPRG